LVWISAGVSHLIHVFPAEAGIQDHSALLLDPGLRRGDDEHQNAKLLFWFGFLRESGIIRRINILKIIS
jgi:hypothetical protein